MAYSNEKLRYWCEKQAVWNEKVICGSIPTGDGRWAVTDGIILYVLERKPRGLSEIKTENQVPYLRDVGVANIINTATRDQNPRLLEITTKDLESLKRKLKNEKRKVFRCDKTAFDINRLLQAASVMGKGCRFYCAGKSAINWMWIYPSENMNSLAIVLPVVGYAVHQN